MNALNEAFAIERASEAAIRVLLIEDDVELCRAITDYLGKQGITVAAEGRGDQAFKRITDEKPDLVILDVMLPGKDGFDVGRKLGLIGSTLYLLPRAERPDDVQIR